VRAGSRGWPAHGRAFPPKPTARREPGTVSSG
jgi:hypothetical protein